VLELSRINKNQFLQERLRRLENPRDYHVY
jgi:hypothetical protein